MGFAEICLVVIIKTACAVGCSMCACVHRPSYQRWGATLRRGILQPAATLTCLSCGLTCSFGKWPGSIPGPINTHQFIFFSFTFLIAHSPVLTHYAHEQGPPTHLRWTGRGSSSGSRVAVECTHKTSAVPSPSPPEGITCSYGQCFFYSGYPAKNYLFSIGL